MLKNLSALSLITWLSLPSSANAGAWLAKKDGGQLITNYYNYFSNLGFNDEGKLVSQDIFNKFSFNPYFEYGVHEDLTLGISSSLEGINNNDSLKDTFNLSVGNTRIFGRTYVYNDEINHISIEPALTIPSNSDNDLNSDGNKIIPEVKISYGTNFGKDFFDIGVNYRIRTDNDLNDVLKSEVSYGYRLNDEFTILGQVFNETSLGDVDAAENGNYDLTKIQLSGIWDKHKRISYHIGFSVDLLGRNTGAGIATFFTKTYKF